MKSFDFEYDGIRLSDFGFVICSFSSDSLSTVSNGSQITFNTVSTLYGTKNEVVSAEYSDCLEATFQICKNMCTFGDSNSESFEITQEDLRTLLKWLNRKEFHKFKLLEDQYINYYFEASFNISKLLAGGRVIGLDLNMITNRPFALLEPRKIKLSFTDTNMALNIYDSSDEEGFIYPDTTITIKSEGTLKLYNSIEDRTTYIENCSVGEVITMQYPIIQSSFNAHKLMNDFNWNFFRISNTFGNNKNSITSSLLCDIELVYSPIAKITI